MTNDKDFNISLGSITVRRPNYPYNCFTLDLSQNTEVREKGIKQIFFIFHALEDQSVELLLIDKSLDSNRDIKKNKFFSLDLLLTLKI